MCMACKASPTGQFFSGKRAIATPSEAAEGQRQDADGARGAREQFKGRGRHVPARGSWWRSRAHRVRARARSISEILYKALWKRLVDTRTLPGRSRRRGRRGACPQGGEHRPVADRAQQPVESGDLYRLLRHDSRLFTRAPLSVERGYKSGRFSFNVKGGRCEECQGEGVITTQLYFMPDVEVTCGVCKGARFGSETLEVTLRGKTITTCSICRSRRAWRSSRASLRWARRSRS